MLFSSKVLRDVRGGVSKHRRRRSEAESKSGGVVNDIAGVSKLRIATQKQPKTRNINNGNARSLLDDLQASASIFRPYPEDSVPWPYGSLTGAMFASC